MSNFTLNNETIKYLVNKIIKIIPNNLSELNNDLKLTTENDVKEQIEKMNLSFAKVEDVEKKVDKVSGKQLSTEDFTTAEKEKLTTLENYILPKATKETLGGIKVGAGFSTASDGTLSVSAGGTADAINWENVLGKPESYNPSAHSHTIKDITDYKEITIINDLNTGGIDKALSAEQGKELNTLLANKIDKSENKQLSTEDFTTEEKQKLNELKNYSLPIANTTTLGGVKIGEGINISEDGTISVSISQIPTQDLNWSQIIGKPSVIDNLDSDSSTDVLSARQGKELKSLLNTSSSHIHDNIQALNKITDESIDKWNNKADSIHTHEATQITTDSSHRFITDEERKKWNTTFGANTSYTEVKKMTITEWTLDEQSKLQKSTVVHNLNTDNLIINAFNTTNGFNELIGYKIIDMNTIEVIAEDAESIDLQIFAGLTNLSESKEEIDDNIESSTEKTWSSNKINTKLNELSDKITRLEQNIAEQQLQLSKKIDEVETLI